MTNSFQVRTTSRSSKFPTHKRSYLTKRIQKVTTSQKKDWRNTSSSQSILGASTTSRHLFGEGTWATSTLGQVFYLHVNQIHFAYHALLLTFSIYLQPVRTEWWIFAPCVQVASSPSLPRSQSTFCLFGSMHASSIGDLFCDWRYDTYRKSRFSFAIREGY